MLRVMISLIKNNIILSRYNQRIFKTDKTPNKHQIVESYFMSQPIANTLETSHDDEHHDHGPAKGFKRWLFTTNHKDIGTLYLTFSLIMLFVGGFMALLVRV